MLLYFNKLLSTANISAAVADRLALLSRMYGEARKRTRVYIGAWQIELEPLNYLWCLSSSARRCPEQCHGRGYGGEQHCTAEITAPFHTSPGHHTAEGYSRPARLHKQISNANNWSQCKRHKSDLKIKHVCDCIEPMYFTAAGPRITCFIRSSGFSVRSGTKTEILLLWGQEWEMQHVTPDRTILTYFSSFKKTF